MKAGEGNSQAREEGKLSLFSNGAQLISGWNPQNVGIGIPWESHCSVGKSILFLLSKILQKQYYLIF